MDGIQLMDAPTRVSYDPAQHRGRTFHDVLPDFLAGRDDPRAYLERCLETIDLREPEVRAFVTTNVSAAREAADAARARYRAGVPLSPVDGMPIAVKDLYETADMPTQMGSPIFNGWRTNRDAASVHALRTGGAVVIAKAVTTEFGFYNPGPTTNPFARERTPGGSSSGSAAAVGAGMIPAAIGSQVIGSLIRPASFCGNHGFKPTLGALNRQGGHSGLSQATIGVHAASLEDIWATAYQIASVVGGDPGAPGLYGEAKLARGLRPERLIGLQKVGRSACSPDTQAQLEWALHALEESGVRIVTGRDDREVAELDEALLEARTISDAICGYELRWPLAHYREKYPDLLSDDISKRLDRWLTISPQEYRMMIDRRQQVRARFEALEAVSDGIVTLAATGAAPIGLSSTGDPILAVMSSLLGAPAVTLPVLSVEAMPLGLQLISFAHRDWRLLGMAMWVEQCLLHAAGRPYSREPKS
ncbi:MAG: amidase [Alphaproteobacteria bacterium]|nr:amidase [Alphaproteobacteria bacterium]